MIALIKLIIVLVLSVFSGEPNKEIITNTSQNLKMIKYQKVEKLPDYNEACIPV